MGKPTYYNQKDQDQFHDGWFLQTGREMKARGKDGSLTLGGAYRNQAAAFDSNATRSTMPSAMPKGKTPDATFTMPLPSTLLSRPTGQPATAPTIPKIPGATPSASASSPPTGFGQPRRTPLTMGPMENLPGKGAQKMQSGANSEGAPSESASDRLNEIPLREGMHGHPGDESTAKVGQGAAKALQGVAKLGEESVDRGDINDRIDKIYAEKGVGQLTPEQESELSRLKSKLADMPGGNEEEGFFTEMYRETLEGLGARKEDFKASILGQDDSSRLTLSKDPVSRVGEYLYKRIKSDFGGNFRNLSDMKDPQGNPMDEDAARVGAVLVTSVELAMEALGGKALKAIPGADKAKQAILQRVVNAAMGNDKIRAMVVQGSKQLGEGLESVIVEVSKGLTELVTTEVAKQESNVTGTEFEGASGVDVVDVVKSAPREGVKDLPEKKVRKGLLSIFK